MLARRPAILAAASTALLPRLAQSATDPYDVPMQNAVRIIHQTDTHANAAPIRYREPDQNIGIASMAGHPPHLVGAFFLDHYGIRSGSRAAHAFTCLDYERLAHRYGRLGGFAALKTVVDTLRAGAGPGRSLLLDGGDLCQGSALAHLTGGLDMVALANRLGIDAMTGHWEFTYGQHGLAAIIHALDAPFIAQNVFLSAEARMQGAAAFDQATGQVFAPSIVRERGGHRIAVIGQAFPYVPIAHPRRFTPDWRFGIREASLQRTVDHLRTARHADAVLLLSHNGMDADLKLASRITGIDIILGGHTHDAVPRPVIVRNRSGRTIVTNAGTAGKFVAVLDLDLAKGRLRDLHYRLLPIYTDHVTPDPGMASAIAQARAPHATMLDEPLATIDTLLYRRDNFTGTIDQVIMDALRAETGAEIAFSPGFRWGNAFLPGETFTMGDLMGETAITYPAVYTTMMTGAAIKAMMEDVCDNLFNPDPYLQQGGDMVRVGGMDYVCAPANPIGKRISGMTLDDGRTIEPTKSYRIVSWASVSRPQTGPPVWDMVARHLRQRRTITLPRPNRVRLTGVRGNPGLIG